ncbi:uncharacterized protein LOC119725800 [Patiria miniata]|uniref:Uncharacterized protein n=1 Tax=Patiria miniata TaxID=46514 RepID=A0A913ZQ97_PATMI|nr:uncharacterized protein LOC119725800 [Patiria miniata]
MFPKRTVPEVPEKKDTTVYIFGEKDVQVALSRASRTEVKRAVICACAVVVTTLILVAGTLGAIALWLSFHHMPHDGHFVGLFNGDSDSAKPSSPGDRIDDGGLWPLGGESHADVTESITEVPEAATGAGDILIDGNDRSPAQSETTTVRPRVKQTPPTAPPTGGHHDSSEWDSFSAPYSVLSEQDPSASADSYDSLPSASDVWDEAGSGSYLDGSGSYTDQDDTDQDQDDSDYAEIPYRSSGTSGGMTSWLGSSSSSFPGESHGSAYDFGTSDTRSDPDWERNDQESGSGSGDAETSGDNIVYAVDTHTMDGDNARPVLQTPQEFTVVRYPVPVSYYHTLCTLNTCTLGFTKGEDRVEVIETDLRMKPQKLTVLRKSGGRLFTIIRDEDQGYRAVLLYESGLCLLTRLENTDNLDIRHNSAMPIVEKLRVTLPVELPEPLLSQIGGPIMETCRDLPVFWAQQVGDSDDVSFINRIRRSSAPSRGDPDDEDENGMTLGGGIHFQCCWCADEDDPCPCECGRF